MGAPALCLLASCSGTSPREGTILYRDAAPKPGVMQRENLQPVTILFASGDRDLAQEDAVWTVTGKIEGSGNTRSTSQDTSLRIAERILQGSRSAPPIILTPERFAELWALLDDAGLFSLPQYPGASPPTDRPYILVESKGSKRIFVQPRVDSPRPGDPELDFVASWRQSKIVLFNFLNSSD